MNEWTDPILELLVEAKNMTRPIAIYLPLRILLVRVKFPQWGSYSPGLWPWWGRTIWGCLWLPPWRSLLEISIRVNFPSCSRKVMQLVKKSVIGPFRTGPKQMTKILTFHYLINPGVEAIRFQGTYFRKLFWKGPRTLQTWTLPNNDTSYLQGPRTLQS